MLVRNPILSVDLAREMCTQTRNEGPEKGHALPVSFRTASARAGGRGLAAWLTFYYNILPSSRWFSVDDWAGKTRREIHEWLTERC